MVYFIKSFNFACMKEPLYRQALAFGWDLAWNNKRLWVYGFFAAMLGQMGMFEIIARLCRSISTAAPLGWTLFTRNPRAMMAGLWANHTTLPPDGWIWGFWIVIFCLAVIGFFVSAAIISQGALIHVAAEGKLGRALERDGVEWHVGVDHFWGLFTVNLIRKLLVGFLAFWVGWSALSSAISHTAGSTLAFLAIFFIALLLGIILSFYTIYAAGYIVVERYPVGKALLAAWELFVKHWLVSLEVGSLFLFFNLFVTVLGIGGFLIILWPTIILWFFAVVTLNNVLFFLAVLVLFFLFAAYLAILGSIFTVFTTAVWTYLFTHMHHHGIESRLLHWMKRS